MDDSMRLDKWLWVSRFFKTRPLATAAVNGGKVHLNGNRVKPGRSVKIGDSLNIQRGYYNFDIRVLGIHKQRRPASDAQQLYEETETSIAAREKQNTLQQLAAGSRQRPARKPDKHERGKIVRFKRQQQ